MNDWEMRRSRESERSLEAEIKKIKASKGGEGKEEERK